MFQNVNGKWSPFQMGCNLVIRLLRPLSLSVELLLHSDVGDRYAGLNGVLALAAMGGWAFLPPETGWVGMACFAGLFVLRLIGHQSDRENRGNYGQPLHTRSPGVPFFGWWRDRFEEKSLRFAEGWVAMIAGFGMSYLSEAVGSYLTLAGMATLVVVFLRGLVTRDRLLDLRDAELERHAQVQEIMAIRRQLSLSTITVSPVARGELVNATDAPSHLPAGDEVLSPAA